MTREIKFKYVFETDNGYRTKKYTLKEIEGFDPETPFCFSDPKSGKDICVAKPTYRLQYTGLKDHTGEEIYEGDIVRTRCLDNLVPISPFRELYKIYEDGELGLVSGNIFVNPETISPELFAKSIIEIHNK